MFTVSLPPTLLRFQLLMIADEYVRCWISEEHLRFIKKDKPNLREGSTELSACVPIRKILVSGKRCLMLCSYRVTGRN